MPFFFLLSSYPPPQRYLSFIVNVIVLQNLDLPEGCAHVGAFEPTCGSVLFEMLIIMLLCPQAANGYILLFDVLGGQEDKYLYEAVYPKWETHTHTHTLLTLTLTLTHKGPRGGDHCFWCVLNAGWMCYRYYMQLHGSHLGSQLLFTASIILKVNKTLPSSSILKFKSQ